MEVSKLNFNLYKNSLWPMGIVFNEQSQIGRSVFLVWFQGNSNENEPAVFFCFVLEGREGVGLFSLFW